MSAQKPIIQKTAVLANNPAGSPTWTDFTEKAYDFTLDPFTATIDQANGDWLYVGRPKAWNAVYFNVTTPQATAATLVAEYWNGSTWASLDLLTDDTNGFTRAGFVKFDKMGLLTGSATDWKATEVNSTGLTWFYVRFQLSITPSGAIGFTGIGLVFADDRDMKTTKRDVMKYLPKDENGAKASSFISAHVEARKMILRWFREANIKKFSVADGNYWDIDEWDFHNIDQLRQAATYLALHVAFFAQVGEKDDPSDKRQAYYLKQARGAITLPLISIDSNDDGYEGIEEKNSGFSAGYLLR